MNDVPVEIAKDRLSAQTAQLEESVASARANSLDTQFRPQLNATLNLVRDVFRISAESGMTRVGEIRRSLPERVMFPISILRSQKFSNYHEAMVIPLHGKVEWKLMLEYGWVKTPGQVAESGGDKREFCYPAITITEVKPGEINGIEMADIRFDEVTSKPTCVIRSVMPTTRERLYAAQRDYADDNQVNAFVIELLKESIVRSASSN